ncbi:MAG: DNA repair protein RecN [Cytophagales bacterium]|nr:DNA repair protein RecN [Cytophagales bacterium]
MLKHLFIKNYVLIQELTIYPSKQLNIITGETGAGKSILLGAVSLLLGERVDTKVLLNREDKCIIEGTFAIQPYDLASFFESESLDYEKETTIRREITPVGKSRAFINDTPVTLATLKALGSRLVDIHSQYDALLLGNASFQLDVIDIYAGNQALKAEYSQAFHNFQTAQQAYESLIEESAQSKKSLDYDQFLLNELKEAHLKAGQQEQLERDLQLLENAATIKTDLYEGVNVLDDSAQSVSQRLAEVNHTMRQLVAIAEKYAPLQERLESCSIELKDIITELKKEAGEITTDPAKLEETREQLNIIYRLQQKHQTQTIEALLTIQAELEEKVNKVSNLDEVIEREKVNREKAQAILLEKAQLLSTARKKVFEKIKKEIESLLSTLGMPEARLAINATPVFPNVSGADELQILFSANKGIQLQPLKNVVSGGEFARLMLCLKFILADKTALPTLIFDEIDTGVSGEIALKMANMMKKMAYNHQVIAITHLPQIAARGDQHYFVYKDNRWKKTTSNIRQLSAEERILTLAKMIGGDNPSEIVLENARELLT